MATQTDPKTSKTAEDAKTKKRRRLSPKMVKGLKTTGEVILGAAVLGAAVLGAAVLGAVIVNGMNVQSKRS